MYALFLIAMYATALLIFVLHIRSVCAGSKNQDITNAEITVEAPAPPQPAIESAPELPVFRSTAPPVFRPTSAPATPPVFRPTSRPSTPVYRPPSPSAQHVNECSHEKREPSNEAILQELHGLVLSQLVTPTPRLLNTLNVYARKKSQTNTEYSI